MNPALAFAAPATPLVQIADSAQYFPVHRIYCVGRNYADHAREMGFTGREPPFFFMKPADAVAPAQDGGPVHVPYPTLTHELHHEVELVVAIGRGGSNIPVEHALQHVFGYAVGLDMTRRDLQNHMKQQGRPWCIGKGFDASAPIGFLMPAAQAGDIARAEISLSVNGQRRQHSNTGKLIWNIAETIAALSQAWMLQPGDLIYTGTPEGVGAVSRGDTLDCQITGLPALQVQIT